MPNTPIIVLMGAAGSGKGTQAALLVERLGYQKIEAGAIVRARAKEDSDIGRQLRKFSESGQLTPAPIISDLLKDHVVTIPKDQVLLIDGYPRSSEQDKYFKKMLIEAGRDPKDVIAVWLNVGLKEATRRLLNRGMCQACGHTFPNRDVKVCTQCGGNVEPRKDDVPEAISKRLALFVQETMAVIEEYKGLGQLREINGEQDVENVYNDVVKAIGAK